MALIRIQQYSEQTDAFHAKVSFNEGLQYDVTVHDPFTEEEEERLEWYFEEHLKFPFLDQVKAQEAATSITEYGEKLFAQVFPADSQIFSTYKTAIKAGLDKVQIEIAGEPLFQAFHWEALKDSEFSWPLALQATFVRKILSPQAGYTDMRSSPTINLLIVTARPHGKRDIGYRTISRPLVESLRQDRLPVKIDILRPGTYKALDHHLRATTEHHGVGYYHVIHFDVHGAVQPYPQIRHLLHNRFGRHRLQPYEDMKAFLFLEGEKDNSPDPLEAAELAKLLRTHQVPIAILNACQSGKQVGASETSLASHLTQNGVQMVLAMGYSVTVSAAELFMRTLYQRLFTGDDLTVAIRHARADLANNRVRSAYFNQKIELEDWLLPVVYQNQSVTLQPREFTSGERKDWLEREAEKQRYTPPDPTYGFVGRDLDILRIEKYLLTRRNILLVRGMGGAGKTTLLQHLAAWWHTTGFVQRVFFFGYDDKTWTLQQIMAKIAQALYGPRYYTDFQPLPSKAQQALLSQRLRAENHLLILDNLESITGAHLAIGHTLSQLEQGALHSFLIDLANGNTLVLLGSRSSEDWLANGTFDDNIYELAGLDKEAASTLANRILLKNNAALFRQHPDLQHILKLLDGFPLALEVVLANLAHQTPAEVLLALQAGDVRLDVDNSKQQDKTIFEQKIESILYCIDYSHGNLSQEAQQLSLCFAPFTSVIRIDQNVLNNYLDELRQQPVLSNLPFERWSEVIREAQNWGLLSSDPDVLGFLHLQPIFPYFLRNRLHAPEHAEMRKAIETAFRQHYDAMGAALYKLLHSTDPEERQVGQLLTNLEYENLQTALKLALATQVSIGSLYLPLSNYLEATQDLRRGLELGQSVLTGLENYTPELLRGHLGYELAGVISKIANLQFALKQYREAEVSYQKALSLWLENKSYDANTIRKRSASIYHGLGMVSILQHQWQQAEQYFQQALQIEIEFNDRYSQANTYHHLGILAQEQHQWQQAEQYFQQALQIKIEFNDRYSQADTYLQLGNVAAGQYLWLQAEQYFQQALQIFVGYNDHNKQATAYHNLGVIARDQHLWTQAEHYYLQALHIYIEHSDRYEQAGAYGQLGIVSQIQRKWLQAEQYFQQALQIFTEYNERYEQADVYGQLGLLAQEQHQWLQAEQYYQRALQLYGETNDRYKQANTYGHLGVMALKREQWAQAQAYFLQALEIFVAYEDTHYIGTTLSNLANLWRASSDKDLSAAIASLLGASVKETEALLRQMPGENGSDEGDSQ